MKAIILAAGFGTRLHPLTENKAKPLLEIKGRPLLDYIVKKIPSDVEEIILVSNGKFYDDFVKWNDNSEKKLKIINNGVFSNEERQGGISDLWLAISKLGIDDILVLHGDTLFDFSLEEFVNSFKEARNVSIGLHKMDFEEAKRFGVVEVSHGKIIGIEEKPKEPKSDLIMAGFYIIPKEKIVLIEDYLKTDKNKEGVTFLIQDWVGKEPISPFVFEGVLEDIGTREVYERLK